jgi:S-adenosylmethionine-diacylglycerol 3-amino-3-carboxypropyl transferase
MQSNQGILEAVSIDKAGTRKGVLQRLFAYYFDAFVYNQIWEDPTVDLEALQLDHESRVLTISSGGCNVLNYLKECPSSITAVDLNRYHVFLLNFKLTALRRLPDHESFFRFFGHGKHPSNLEAYRQFIAPHLDDETRAFWQGNSYIGSVLSGERIEYFDRRGLYDHSRNGYFLRFFHSFAHLIGLRPEKLLEAETLEEQQQIFDRHIAPFFDSRFVRLLGKLPITTFGLGIPPQQLAELKTDLSGRSLIELYRERVHRFACGFPISDNYFAWQAFGRKYDTEGRSAIPDYLREENFATIRDNSHRVTTAVTSVSEMIDRSPANTFNRFVFLDAQDWMDKRSMEDLWTLIAEKGEPGSRIIFRTASSSSPLPSKVPLSILKKYRYDEEFSHDLSQRDRASIYGRFHLYILENG